MTSGVVSPPAPESLARRQEPDVRHYARALAAATQVVEHRDRFGVTYCWILPPSRNTWPTWHVNRPAPTPGCGCAPCHRPRCCNTWAEPVELIITGEVVAWICPTCLEPAPANRADGDVVPDWISALSTAMVETRRQVEQ